ncbi:MAG: amidohydrolase, partial [Halothiobacillus sp.]|nr:amidohydrolase [Halothiobacillus sp.]
MSSTWAQNIQEATALRHRLHRSPELSWQEHGTAQIIRSQLKALDIPWRACANTGTVATLAPNATGRHIALRGDIDALPITEQTVVDWISQTPGVMHACGHDGHTATLMAVARWLKTNESALAGPVSLLFQPAEEGGHGARVMIEDGALDGVDWIFGWHNWPAIPFGQAVCPDGPVMAANGIFEIELTGRGGHASQPELCRDPVLAAAAVTL